MLGGGNHSRYEPSITLINFEMQLSDNCLDAGALDVLGIIKDNYVSRSGFVNHLTELLYRLIRIFQRRFEAQNATKGSERGSYTYRCYCGQIMLFS